MLVSLHLPKTAGSSFRNALQSHFGAGLRVDYDDAPLALARKQRLAAAQLANVALTAEDFAGVECVHGHFLPYKYLGLAASQSLQFVTWLRHPIDRLCSHYFYWQRDHGRQAISPLRRQMLDESWSLRQFGLHPQLRNLYSEFLWSFPLQLFSFIGMCEFYAEDLAEFSAQFLDADLERHVSNVGEMGPAASYEVPADLREELERAHQPDMQLYARALELRGQRQIPR